MNGGLMNQFEAHEIGQALEAEMLTALQDISTGDNRELDGDEIIAAMAGLGATCVVVSPRISVTSSGGVTFEFEKHGESIRRRAEVIRDNFHEKMQVPIANILAEQFQGVIAYDHAGEKWYTFDGIWRVDKTARAKALIHGAVEDIRQATPQDTKEHRRERAEMARANFVTGIERLMRDTRQLAVNMEDFDLDIYLLGCPQG